MARLTRLEKSYKDWLKELEDQERVRQALSNVEKEVQREVREGYGDN